MVLSRSEFDAAVKRALRELTRPDRLAANPLALSRLVLDRVRQDDDPKQRVEQLAQLLAEAVRDLERHPSTRKAHRAMVATYLEPAATQEAAAQRIGIPFSTYRRHLVRGVASVADALWRVETG